VSPYPSRFDLAAALRLEQVRSLLRRSHTLGLAVLLGVAYALGSLLFGGMLALYPEHGPSTIEILLGGSAGSWSYPALLVVAPWGVLALPFFATFAMVVVAVGVGLGMAVAVVLVYRLIRPTVEEAARTKSIGIATGLTPAMISLVTIGSCCTTTAAATGGIGLLAQASGTSTSNLIVNNWYLGLAQMVIVWVALLGQELLLTVYGGLLGLSGGRPARPQGAMPRVDRRWAAGATLRALLAIGGLLWSLSMFAEWTTHPPGAAGAGWWFRWIVQHQLVAGVAVGAAFFPEPFARGFRALRGRAGTATRAVLGAAALSLLVWLPAPLVRSGLDSLTGQVLGALALPVAWGAIPLGPVTGVALIVRWGLEFVVPAGFLLAAVVAPERAFAPLLATTLRPSVPGTAISGASGDNVPPPVGAAGNRPSAGSGLSGSGPSPEPP
jgi:hypothetical protein